MITAPPRLTAKDTVRLLYDALHPTRDVFDLRHMQDDLADTLAAQPRVLVIEEAHLLTTDAADQLHYLQHRPGAQWSLVLEGGPHLLTPIRNSAGLYGDVLATVEVTRFHDPADAVAAIRQMHPMFTYADQKLLLTLDQQEFPGTLAHLDPTPPSRAPPPRPHRRHRAGHAGPAPGPGSNCVAPPHPQTEEVAMPVHHVDIGDQPITLPTGMPAPGSAVWLKNPARPDPQRRDRRRHLDRARQTP